MTTKGLTSKAEQDLREIQGDRAVDAFIKLFSAEELKNFDDSFCGQYSSDEEFARETAMSIGNISDDVHWPATCIDWEEAASELMNDYYNDYYEEGGYYFRTY